MLLLSVAVVLWTPIWEAVTTFLPDLKKATWSAVAFRYTATGLFLAGGLILAHIWLPPQRLAILSTLPGTLLTLLLWLTGAGVFGWWLSHFATYASTYAGLGGIMAVIFFLYINSVAFILGGELNAVLMARRHVRESRAATEAAREAEPEPAADADVVSPKEETSRDGSKRQGRTARRNRK
jgi:membrane protein